MVCTVFVYIFRISTSSIFVFPERQRITKLVNWNLLSGKYSLYLVALPTSIIFSSLILSFPGTNDLIHDYCMLPYYFTFFITGFIVQASPLIWQRIEENRRLSLKIAIICIVIINYFRWNSLEPWDTDLPLQLSDLFLQHTLLALYALNAWMWVLAMAGYGRRYLNFYHPILAYANEAIYPFYILHQTTIVIIGYYVIQVQESILMKYIFINVVSFVLIMALYECLVKPFRLTRFLFGMKAEKKIENKVTTNTMEPAI